MVYNCTYTKLSMQPIPDAARVSVYVVVLFYACSMQYVEYKCRG